MGGGKGKDMGMGWREECSGRQGRAGMREMGREAGSECKTGSRSERGLASWVGWEGRVGITVIVVRWGT